MTLIATYLQYAHKPGATRGLHLNRRGDNPVIDLPRNTQRVTLLHAAVPSAGDGPGKE